MIKVPYNVCRMLLNAAYCLINDDLKFLSTISIDYSACVIYICAKYEKLSVNYDSPD